MLSDDKLTVSKVPLVILLQVLFVNFQLNLYSTVYLHPLYPVWHVLCLCFWFLVSRELFLESK